MFETIELPMWFVVIAAVFAAIAALERALIPSVRWFFRRRMQRVVSRLNARLDRPIEPFKLARRHDMIQRLLYHPDVMQAVNDHARKEGIPENVAFQEARKYAREIVPSFSASVYFTVASTIARFLSETLYRVRIGRFEDVLSGLDPKATVVFVMNHRSNMDYVLVTYLASKRSALSYAVGEWARIWPISLLIRAMGAFFIRSLKSSISTYNVGTLSEIQNLNLHDFGIYLELEPEEEDKAMLEQNIQMALQQGGIDLEDAIDIRQIKNLKLANDVLKQKRRKRQEQEQQAQQANIQAQAQAQQQTQQAQAMAEVEKQQAISGANVQYEQAKNQMEIQRMQTAWQIKQQEMEIKHQYDMQLKRLEIEAMKEKEGAIEDRKDQRSKQEATQQSKMISQRQNDLPPSDFGDQPARPNQPAFQPAPSIQQTGADMMQGSTQ